MIRHLREIQARRQGEGTELESGFTLIELLIVIVVIGILAATVIFALGGVSGQSDQSACNSDAKSVQTAAVEYYSANNNTYPSSVNALVPTFLHASPSNSHYTITTTGGVVTVTPVGTLATGGVNTATNYDSQVAYSAGPPVVNGTGCYAVG